MNTLAHAVTLFTEPGATISGPVAPGPTLYEWARGVLFGTFEDPRNVAERFHAELKDLRPESHPSRALYGEYIHFVYSRARTTLPDGITLVEHTDTVTGITRTSSHDIIHLASGDSIAADATIIASGWERPAHTPAESDLSTAIADANRARPATSPLVWIEPDNPIEQPLDLIPSSETILVRGLGMGFFDLLTLLTEGRGGRFVGEATSPALTYQPSGNEPHIVVTSRRGYPFLPKSLYNSLPPRAALTRLKATIAALGPGTSPIDFDTQVYPAIIRDAADAYYTTLHRTNPSALPAPLDTIRRRIDTTSPADILATDLAELSAYDLTTPTTLTDLTTHIYHRLAADLHDAHLGTLSPLKAALWSISASRKPASILGAGRYTWESRSNLYASTMALGQMIGSGPPAFRTAQLRALIAAGIVTFAGPNPHITVTPDGFHLATPAGETITTRVLADAWMHDPNASNPRPGTLPHSLAHLGLTRLYQHRRADGTPVDSSSFETCPTTRRLIHPDGTVDERIALIGIPTGGQMPDTTISPMPGTNPLMLQETDRAATAALATLFG